MKTKILFIGMLALSLLFSCNSNDGNDGLKSQTIDLSKLDLSDLNISWKETIKKEKFTDNLSDEDKKSRILSEIDKLNKQIETLFKEEKKLGMVEYSLVASKDGFLLELVDLKSKKVKLSAKGGPANPFQNMSFNCPEGQVEIANCRSESCVKGALSKALGGIKSGQTVRLTVHHGGVFGGVSVCAG